MHGPGARGDRPRPDVPHPPRGAAWPPAASRNPLSLFDVSDRVTVITGASGAFGRVVAVSLGALGSRLLLVSGSAGGLAAVAAEVAAGGGVATLAAGPTR